MLDTFCEDKTVADTPKIEYLRSSASENTKKTPSPMPRLTSGAYLSPFKNSAHRTKA